MRKFLVRHIATPPMTAGSTGTGINRANTSERMA